MDRAEARHWSSLLAAIFGALLIAILGLVGSASADPFGTCSGAVGCHADNNLHTYCYGAGFDSDLEDEADFAMGTSLDADTVMADQFFTSCDSTADVKWQDANLGPGIRGDYRCLDPDGNFGQDECFASRIRLDPDELNIGSNDPEDRKKTACHEVGHSVGLEHGDGKTDCMVNGEIPDTTAQWRAFNSHHINGHIDPYYS